MAQKLWETEGYGRIMLRMQVTPTKHTNGFTQLVRLVRLLGQCYAALNQFSFSVNLSLLVN